MKSPTYYRLLIVAASFLAVSQLSARPIGFSELSLMVRMHESEADIQNDVAGRKLLHGLTQPQEGILKSQGASDSLIKSLRDSNLVLSKEEAAAAESAAARESSAPSAEIRAGNHSPQIEVFDVAFGHPINLSQWGGLDYEVAFYSYRFAGEDHIQPTLIDNVGTRTVVSPLVPTAGLSVSETFPSDWFPTNGVRNWRFMPYNGVDYDNRGDFRDARSIYFSDTVGVSSYSVSRPIAVDWDSPVFFDGQAYTFYPVYGGGGVSLYYISSNSYSARIAVAVDKNLIGGNVRVSVR
jgi:hypothetical protein